MSTPDDARAARSARAVGPRHVRARVIAAIVACLALVPAVGACESIGAPEAYRSQICGATRDLAGPGADAVTALESAATAHDRAAMTAALDSLDPVLKRINADLVDVPEWISGVDVTNDLKALMAADATATAGLRQAIAGGHQAAIDAAMAAFEKARQTSPGLGDHMRTARLAGLNC